MTRLPKFGVGIFAALLGLAFFGQGAYIGGKAVVAQILMERAWVKTAKSGEVHLPWAWIDAHPAARLSFDGKSHIVLNSDSGQALAFGPAIISGTQDRAMMGIAAHKNTQFKGLKDLQAGDIVTLELPKEQPLTYRVTHNEILDSRTEGIPLEDISDNPDRLALVTCYPFDSVSFNGPMRYVVYAELSEISQPRDVKHSLRDTTSLRRRLG